MTSATDFISWDDIDLDDLLGEYTDDLGVEVSSCSSENEEKEEGAAKKARIDAGTPANTVLYRCPDCQNGYKSISGFRGHMAKKHRKPGVKATQFKLKDPTATNTVPSLSKTSCIDALRERRDSLIKAVLSRIATDSDNTNENSQYGGNLVKVAGQLHFEDQLLREVFDGLLNILPVDSLSTAKDREMVFCRFHDYRTDSHLVGVFQQNLMERGLADFRNAIMFFQVFLEELFDDIVKEEAQQLRNFSEQQLVSLDKNDQEVVFYIAGFVLKKMKVLKINVSHFLQTEAVTEAKENSSPSMMPGLKWTEKVNRGGLTMPSKATYGFFAMIELELRKSVDLNKLCADTLQKDSLMETLMESSLVKQAWDFIGCRANTLLCEKFIKLYLTVRGYAICKLFKRKLTKSKPIERKVKKDGCSLRKSIR